MNRPSVAMLALFLSGLFGGGVLDHGLLALQGSEVTSYNIHVGVAGTWAFMLMDGAIALGLFLLHRQWIKETSWRRSRTGECLHYRPWPPSLRHLRPA